MDEINFDHMFEKKLWIGFQFFQCIEMILHPNNEVKIFLGNNLTQNTQ